MISYLILLNNKWVDLGVLINSSSLSIEHSLCTIQWKSVTNTIQVTLQGARFTSFYSKVVTGLMSAIENQKDVDFLVREEAEVLFSGRVDLSNISITSAKIPGSLVIKGNDYIIDLDKTPKINYTAENKSITEIIEYLLTLANAVGHSQGIGRNDLGESETLKYFVMTSDDNNTYRQIIDKILFEAGGFVLYRNIQSGQYEIRSIISNSNSSRVVNYHVKTGLTTSFKPFDKDGVAITYPTVEEKENALVYSENISISHNSDTGEYVGLMINPGEWYPENGEKQATFQSFKKSLLDKPYQEGTSSLQNSDLDLLYVKSEGFELELTTIPQNILTQPQVDLIQKPQDLQVYPRKAWCLLYNPSSEAVEITGFAMRGKAIYKTVKNKIVLPPQSVNPEEYETSYIFDEDKCGAFANFYFNFKHLAGNITTWAEPKKISYIGEIVSVKHASTQINQKHVVVSIQRTGSSSTPMYHITAISISNILEQPYEIYREMFPPKQVDENKAVLSQEVFYAGTLENEKPEKSLMTDKTPPQLIQGECHYIWSYTRTYYSNGTVEDSAVVCVGQITENASLELNGVPDEIQYYADNFIAETDSLSIIAKGNPTMSNVDIYINNSLVTSSNSNIATITIAPSQYLNADNYFIVEARGNNDTIITNKTCYKRTMSGGLDLSANRNVVQYYADNVAHPDQDVNLTISSDGYKTKPTLKIDGAVSAVTTIPASAFLNKSNITAEVEIPGFEKRTITIIKQIDIGYLKLYTDGTEFEFYADNVPHNLTDSYLITMDYSGFSTTPTLTKNGTVIPYSSVGVTINSGDMVNYDKIEFKAEIANFSDTITLSKIKDIANITLSLSDEVIEFYADNIPIKSSITAHVTEEGLYYPPSLTVDGNVISLDSNGDAVIPTSFLDTKDSVLVRAFTGNVSYAEATKTINKFTKELILSLGLSATQFSVASSGAIQPSSITVTNNTRGLSDNSKVDFLVGGKVATFTNGQYTVTPEMINGRYIVLSIGYGSEYQQTHIVKTFDGQSEEIEYSKTKSFTIYPDESYQFTFNDNGMTYNGENYIWRSVWSPLMPDATSDEYVWRRSRPTGTTEWSYTRLTGVAGHDGSALETYLGAKTTPPAQMNDGTALSENCFYLDVSSPGEPLPYKWHEEQWVLISTTDPSWSYVASITLGDVNKYCFDSGNALLSTSAYYAYFQMMVANKAYIESLGAENIILNSGGSIQSENFEPTNGSEGFKIDSNGDVTFNSGTWRGAFANGLSFIPPVKLSLDKGLTQKEAYQRLKKAGLSSGYYKQEQYGRVNYPTPPLNKEYPWINDRAFLCLDYDSKRVNMNIPVSIITTAEEIIEGSDKYILNSYFGSIGYITPISTSAWLIVKAKKNSNNIESDGCYVLTEDKLKEAMEEYFPVGSFNNEFDFYNFIPNFADKLIKLSINPETISYVNQLDETEKQFYLLAPYIQIVHMDNGSIKAIILNKTDSNYKCYDFDENLNQFINPQNIEIDGSISSNVRLNLFPTPTFFYSKVDNKYTFTAYSGSTNENMAFIALETTDFVSFTTKTTITKAQMKNNENYDCIITNHTIVGDKDYFLAINQTDKTSTYDKDIFRFYSFDLNTHLMEILPESAAYSNEELKAFEGDEELYNAAFNFGKLVYKNKTIYGTMFMRTNNCSTYFTYNTVTKEFKDRITDLANLIDITGIPSEYVEKNLSYYFRGQTLSDSNINHLRWGCFILTDICIDEITDRIFIPCHLALHNYHIYIGFYYNITTGKYSIYAPCGIAPKLFPYNTNTGYINQNSKRTFVNYMALFINGYDINPAPIHFLNRTTTEWLPYYMKLETQSTMTLGEYLDLSNIDTTKTIGKYLLYNYFRPTIFYEYLDLPTNNKRISGYPNLRLLDIDASILLGSAIAPVLGVNTIQIEENENEYRISLPSLSLSLDFNEQLGMVLTSIGGYGIYTESIPSFNFTNTANLEPFLIIKKDSSELLGVTMHFNFPAQFTTSKGIKEILGEQLITWEEISKIDG